MNRRTFKEPQKNPIDPLPGGEAGLAAYKSYQKIINSNNGEVNEDRLAEHLEKMANDPHVHWEEVSPLDFSILRKGDRIRYVTRTQNNKIMFRTGGWITAIDEDNYNWLAYMSHTKTTWSLQKMDCVKLWVTRKKDSKITLKDDTIYFKELKDETNFPVYLKSLYRVGSGETRNDVFEIVYYAKDNYDKKRFESTNKYKSAINSAWNFKNYYGI